MSYRDGLTAPCSTNFRGVPESRPKNHQTNTYFRRKVLLKIITLINSAPFSACHWVQWERPASIPKPVLNPKTTRSSDRSAAVRGWYWRRWWCGRERTDPRNHYNVLWVLIKINSINFVDFLFSGAAAREDQVHLFSAGFFSQLVMAPAWGVRDDLHWW